MEQGGVLEQGLVHPPAVGDVPQYHLLELEERLLQSGSVEGDGEEVGERLANSCCGNNDVQPVQKFK